MAITGDHLETDPRLIQLCLDCNRPRCAGTCEAYTNLSRELAGLPPRFVSSYVHVPFDAYVTIDGRAETVRVWMKINKVRYGTVYQRLRRGIPLERAVLGGKVNK